MRSECLRSPCRYRVVRLDIDYPSRWKIRYDNRQMQRARLQQYHGLTFVKRGQNKAIAIGQQCKRIADIAGEDDFPGELQFCDLLAQFVAQRTVADDIKPQIFSFCFFTQQSKGVDQSRLIFASANRPMVAKQVCSFWVQEPMYNLMCLLRWK